MKTLLTLTIALTMAALLPACGDDDSNEVLAEPLPEWTACSAPDDCVPIQPDCCDACTGGRVVAVHRQYADEARERMTETDCGMASCLAVVCQTGPSATCNAQGQCEGIDAM